MKSSLVRDVTNNSNASSNANSANIYEPFVYSTESKCGVILMFCLLVCKKHRIGKKNRGKKKTRNALASAIAK